jgi:hypothetical protein
MKHIHFTRQTLLAERRLPVRTILYQVHLPDVPGARAVIEVETGVNIAVNAISNQVTERAVHRGSLSCVFAVKIKIRFVAFLQKTT